MNRAVLPLQALPLPFPPRVRLSKRRAKAGVQSGTNAVLVVKHRDMNEKELEAQVGLGRKHPPCALQRRHLSLLGLKKGDPKRAAMACAQGQRPGMPGVAGTREAAGVREPLVDLSPGPLWMTLCPKGSQD